MRRGIIAPVILLPLLLCACGGENAENDLVLDLREDFRTMDTWAGQMDVTADYGQRVYEYTVSFAGSREEGTVLTILAPEEAAVITAEAKEGRTWLDYDGVRLETGPLDPAGLSPMDALPALLEAMKTGAVTETGTENDGAREILLVTTGDPGLPAGRGRETVFRFDKSRKALLEAEIRSDGAAVIRCVFSEFAYTLPENENYITKGTSDDGSTKETHLGGSVHEAAGPQLS